MKILGLDPGTAHFAWAASNYEDTSHNYLLDTYVELPELIETGLLELTYTFAKADTIKRVLLRQAVAEIQELANKHQVDAICYERFMSRPGRPTPGWVERLQYVLGALYFSSTIPIYHVQPSAWKVKILNKYKIESTKTLFGGKLKTEHEADAALISLYIFQREFLKKEVKIKKR